MLVPISAAFVSDFDGIPLVLCRKTESPSVIAAPFRVIAVFVSYCHQRYVLLLTKIGFIAVFKSYRPKMSNLSLKGMLHSIGDPQH